MSFPCQTIPNKTIQSQNEIYLSSLQLSVVVESDIAKLFFNISDDFTFSSGGESVA
jgi:hypothetical protein